MAIAFIKPPLADAGWIGFVVFLLIAFLSWIMNLVGKQKQAPPARRPRPQPARPRDDRLQSEIDQFLREVGGGGRPQQRAHRPERRPPRPQPRRAAAQDAPVEVEIVPEQQRRAGRTPARSRTVTPRQPAPKQPAPRQLKPTSRRHELGERQVVSADLGTALRRHLNKYMQEGRIEKLVEHDLQRVIDAAIEDHARTGPAAAGSSERPPSAPTMAEQVRALLGDRQGVRKAILINEILSRPRALRNQ